MKRVMFLTLALVLLFGAVPAFAQETQPPAVILGEVWWFYFDFGAPDLRVDAYLYRPATSAWVPDGLGGGDWVSLGWPFAAAPAYGTWWWDPTVPPENPLLPALNDSQQRRMSYPSYQYTDEWGFYYAEFMMPRDEVWFPCGFPLQWKCNYVLDPFGTMEWHSPAEMVYECRYLDPFMTILECLQWPYAVDPMDTVSPLEVSLIDEYGFGYTIPFEVVGMYWKFSDFE
jgi:hypothetical protein